MVKKKIEENSVALPQRLSHCFATLKLHNCKQFLAILLSLIILNLPIVIAQQLNVQKYSGRDNVNGFVSRDDILHIEATTESTINPSQIRIFSGNIYFLFDTCISANSFSKCNYTKSMQGFYGSEEYKIKLYDTPTTNTPIDEKTIRITTDVIAPKIELFEINPAQSNQGQTQIHYIATDGAFNPADANTCSGLKEITITAGTQTIANEQGADLCRKENTVIADFSSTSNYEQKNICAKATDKMGLASDNVCVKFSIDKQAPDIKSVEIFEPNGHKITHAHTNQQKIANLVVTIEGNNDDVDISTVTADLSRLNPTLGTKQADDKTGNNYVWHNVAITTPANCGITVSATDLLGNTATKTLNCVIGIDDTSPVPKSITTEFTQDDKPLLGVNGKIIVDFEETGAGMNLSNAFLNLEQIGLSGKAKADSCDKDGTSWKCKWQVTPKISGNKTISIHADTQDDLGNTVAQDKIIRQQIIIDREPPEILGIEKIKLIHNTIELGNVTVAGDTTEWYVKAKGFDKAFANFSDLSEADRVEPEICEEKDNANTCMFSTVIQNSGPYLANITFEFSDLAGNTARKKNNLFVYGLSNELNPNYWKLGTTQCSPKMIDRETTSLIPHPVYCALSLEKKTSNSQAVPVATLLKDPTRCTGDTTGLIADVSIRNAGFDSKHPVLALTLESTNFEINEINVSCPVEIYTKVGDKFTNVPEEEIANFSLSFYNLPFGELNKNVNKDIDEAVDSASKTLKWVGTLQKFVDYAGKICQIKSIISSILGTFDTILTLFDVTAKAIMPLAPAVGTDIDQLRRAMCTGSKGPLEEWLMGSGEKSVAPTMFGVLDNFCAFVDCRLTRTPEKEKSEYSWVRDGASIIGGTGATANWCSTIQDFTSFGTNQPGSALGQNENSRANVFGDLSTKDVNAALKGAGTDVKQQEQLIDVKDSLVWSTACLCVPGILYNLNKYRQIQCRYATCMMEDLKDKGIPKSYCTDTRHYQTCNFVMGEVFSLLPITAFLDKIYKALADVMSNPFAAVSTLMGCICGGCKGIIPGVIDYCKGSMTGALYTACITTKTIAKVGDAAASIMQMTKMTNANYWKVNNDWCSSMEKAQERREQAQE